MPTRPIWRSWQRNLIFLEIEVEHGKIHCAKVGETGYGFVWQGQGRIKGVSGLMVIAWG